MRTFWVAGGAESSGSAWIRAVVFAAGLALLGAPSTGHAAGGSGSMANAGSDEPGYRARACGYDLDHDGKIGGPEDCEVCDGGPVDGAPRDEIYVDCGAGDDEDGTGHPDRPFRTISHAFARIRTAPADRRRAVCFRGRCNETLELPTDGAAGHHERGGFQYPSTPFLLSGWDHDDDGVYPPFDGDDVAELVGDSPRKRAFAIMSDPARSNVEIAHFTARDYGAGCVSHQGFMRPAYGGNDAHHVYVHDLELLDIGKGCVPSSGKAAFLLFMGGSTLRHFAIENVRLDHYGGYAIRGAGNGEKKLGPYRFARMTIRPHGPFGGHAHGIKLWDHIDGVEVVDSFFDADPTSWMPCPSSYDVPGCEPVYAITAAQCTQGWRIHRNHFLDWKKAIAIQPDAGPDFCQSRPMDRIAVDRNRIHVRYDRWRFGDYGIRVLSGEAGTVGDVEITRNELITTAGWEACIWSNAGRSVEPQPGRIRIADNLCVGEIDRYAAILIGSPANEGGVPTIAQQRYEITGNVIARIGSKRTNLATVHAPSELVSNRNVFDPQGAFAWASPLPEEPNAPSLTSWQHLSGADSDSHACAPRLTSGDRPVPVASDACAARARRR